MFTEKKIMNGQKFPPKNPNQEIYLAHFHISKLNTLNFKRIKNKF